MALKGFYYTVLIKSCGEESFLWGYFSCEQTVPHMFNAHSMWQRKNFYTLKGEARWCNRHDGR